MVDFTKPLLTRDGREARLISTTDTYTMGGYAYPVVAMVEGNDPDNWNPIHYTAEGKYHHAKDNQPQDLVNYPWTPGAVKASKPEVIKTVRDGVRTQAPTVNPSRYYVPMTNGREVEMDPLIPGLPLGVAESLDSAIICFQHYSLNWLERSLGHHAGDSFMAELRGERTYVGLPRLANANIPLAIQFITPERIITKHIDIANGDSVRNNLVSTGLFMEAWARLHLSLNGQYGWETEWSEAQRIWLTHIARLMHLF